MLDHFLFMKGLNLKINSELLNSSLSNLYLITLLRLTEGNSNINLLPIYTTSSHLPIINFYITKSHYHLTGKVMCLSFLTKIFLSDPISSKTKKDINMNKCDKTFWLTLKWSRKRFWIVIRFPFIVCKFLVHWSHLRSWSLIFDIAWLRGAFCLRLNSLQLTLLLHKDLHSLVLIINMAHIRQSDKKIHIRYVLDFYYGYMKLKLIPITF